MKKIYFSIAILMVSVGVFAQGTDSVLRSKKGIPVLPQKSDWAIGVDANPFLNYLGNIFNDTQNNSLNMNDQTIYGRYFISNNAALRLALSINNSNTHEQFYVRNDEAFRVDPLTREQVIDQKTKKLTNYGVNLALQKFRGYGRLKGFYGAFGGFTISTDKEEYAYGNAMTELNQDPTTTKLSATLPNWPNNTIGLRTLKIDKGTSKGIHLGLLTGVEYYFAPKISIGAEMSLAFKHEWKSQGDKRFEKLTGGVLEEYDMPDSPNGRTSTTLKTQNPIVYNGHLYLMFHF